MAITFQAQPVWSRASGPSRSYVAILLATLVATIFAMQCTATTALTSDRSLSFQFDFSPSRKAAGYGSDLGTLAMVTSLKLNAASGDLEVALEQVDLADVPRVKEGIIDEAAKDFALLEQRKLQLAQAAGGFGSDQETLQLVARAGTSGGGAGGSTLAAAALTQTPIAVAASATDTPQPVSATDTPVVVAAATSTSAPGLPTSTPEPTLLPVVLVPTDTPVPAPTDTPPPLPTDTPVVPPTATTVPPATDTPVPLATETPEPTDTPAATDTPTRTRTPTPATPTSTPVPGDLIVVLPGGPGTLSSFIGLSSAAPGDTATRSVTLYNGGSTDCTYSLTTSSTSGTPTALWTGPDGLELRIRRGTSIVYNSTAVPYGSVQVTNLDLSGGGTVILSPGGSDPLEVSIRLSPSAPDSYQGLSQGIDFAFTAQCT